MRGLSATNARSFSFSGPYNPLKYKRNLVPRNYPTDQEIKDNLKQLYSTPYVPVRNVRHVNPIRQSGPLPPYEGPYTMEDVRKIFFQTTIGIDLHYCSQLPEELMRRVPGLTRQDAEYITRLGLNPDEEVDFAYIAHNIGLDIRYASNGVFLARQVVTNSKGEKVEVYWNSMNIEELALVNVNHAPVVPHIDNNWEIFLWGDFGIHPLCDYDLCVPNTWFEYEEEASNEYNMVEDQMNIPDELIPRSPRHPNCRRELWTSQEGLQRLEEMAEPGWSPPGLAQDVYRAQFKDENRVASEPPPPVEAGGALAFFRWFWPKDARGELAPGRTAPPQPAERIQKPVHSQDHFTELRQAEVEDDADPAMKSYRGPNPSAFDDDHKSDGSAHAAEHKDHHPHKANRDDARSPASDHHKHLQQSGKSERDPSNSN